MIYLRPIMEKITTRLMASTLVLSVAALAGCGGPSARITPASLSYHQAPLKRASQESTYTVTTEGPGTVDVSAIAIEGMTRTDSNPSVIIKIKTGQEVVSQPRLMSVGSFMGADPGNQPNGAPPIVAGPVVIMASRWATGTIGRKMTASAVDGGGKVVATYELSFSRQLEVGRPKTDWIADGGYRTVVSFSGSNGSAVESHARDNLGQTEADLRIVGGTMTVADAKAGASSLALTRGTQACTNAVTNWSAVAQAKVQQLGADQVQDLVNQLDRDFATGQRKLAIALVEIADEPTALTLMKDLEALRSAPANERQERGNKLFPVLSALASNKAYSGRVRAAALYDEALVHVLCDRHAESLPMLQQASLANAEETDGLFDHSGKELGGHIDRLRAHAEDMLARVKR